MGRIKPEVEIKYICDVIDKNIKAHEILKDRGLLSENILSQLRNLTEDVAILINSKENNLNLDTHYNNVEDSMKYVAGIKKYKYLNHFHNFLQSTVSHYTPSENDAERLMLHYFRYICMIKDTLEVECGIKVLNMLEDFPIYEDNLTKEHYEKICLKIEEVKPITNKYLRHGRFYINKCRPIYSKGKLYYELTLTKATDYYNKFERILMYSKQYIPDNYSIKLSYIEKEVEIFSYYSKIKVIDNFTISIRPCEIRNIGKILGLDYTIEDKYTEYINLMQLLKFEELNLLDILLEDEKTYKNYLNIIIGHSKNNNISDILSKVHERLLVDRPGNNILKYFLVKMENQVIKSQFLGSPNHYVDDLYIKNQSIPFDSMPYAMSLSNHNISWYHLIKAITCANREYELLGRYIKNNAENNNILYTPISDVEKFGKVDELINKYNKALINYGIDKSGKSSIKLENNNLCISSYESNSIDIINKLSSYKEIFNGDIIECLNDELDNYNVEELSEDKKDILRKIFRKTSVAIIHGPAGTGKTKMLEVFAEIFARYNKIFLSNTKTSVENLKRRIYKSDSYNSTIETTYQYNNYDNCDYDILIIDECSTISNVEMLRILEKQNYKLVILSGDVNQIESIKYGNWFSLAYNIFKHDFVYELINTKRTEDVDLLDLWRMVRDNDERAINKISNKEYSLPIGDMIFNSMSEDEITLCLNYDGLYGINNINKFFQEKNSNKEYNIGVDTYKIKDQIVFNDCPRFRTLYNNLKGRIENIEIDKENDCVWFTIFVYEYVRATWDDDYEIIDYIENGTLIRFRVNDFKDSNNDEDEYNHIIPFNLAYAMSIHKAQGLEYESVKIIITSNVEDQITKNIFYTAITRAKKYLKIFWSSESQDKIFDNMKKRNNSRDISILKSKL